MAPTPLSPSSASPFLQDAKQVIWTLVIKNMKVIDGAVHINNNTIRKESQSPIREVLARSCWRAGSGEEASDRSKVRREGKAGPFIPDEVRAQTGSARATTPTVARRRRRVTTATGARAKAYPLR